MKVFEQLEIYEHGSRSDRKKASSIQQYESTYIREFTRSAIAKHQAHYDANTN